MTATGSPCGQRAIHVGDVCRITVAVARVASLDGLAAVEHQLPLQQPVGREDVPDTVRPRGSRSRAEGGPALSHRRRAGSTGRRSSRNSTCDRAPSAIIEPSGGRPGPVGKAESSTRRAPASTLTHATSERAQRQQKPRLRRADQYPRGDQRREHREAQHLRCREESAGREPAGLHDKHRCQQATPEPGDHRGQRSRIDRGPQVIEAGEVRVDLRR